MKKIAAPARGAERLYNIAALPVIDKSSEIRYEGSISKCGDNADWDWGLYEDSNGEWVLMEADGPGCIFNFTQHRYPTSEVPEFRFYFDGSDTPQFRITPAEFGTKPPFMKPLADKFVGPDDNGRGPIWVVRSFVPMEFLAHCKVTSTVKLEGADKALGQGGWGHITYQLYDSADGLETFNPEKLTAAIESSGLTEMYKSSLSLTYDSSVKCNAEILGSGESLEIFRTEDSAVITEISFKIKQFKPEILSGLFIHIYFDGFEKPFVSAPFGTFFGCEYGLSPAKIKTSLLTSDFSTDTAEFSNRFPMPFKKNTRIVIESRLKNAVALSDAVVKLNRSTEYTAETGYFTSSEYYPETPNTAGKNSVIAELRGHGHMAYGVISGREIACGCEGDVRIFIDGIRSPAVESDGSESWGSYGWGFVCPPQCNPFSAYNGVYGINDTWSELRLTFTDSYPFLSSLRFELEHGCQNDGGGFHSGQIFAYMLPEPAEQLIAEILPTSDKYKTDGKTEKVENRFENGIHENYFKFDCMRDMTFSELKLAVPADTRSIVLKRVSMQDKYPACAEVFTDGEKVTERKWLFPDSNTIYSLLEDSFKIPEKYIHGKTEITVTIKPTDRSWSECGYKIFAVK